MNTWESSTYYVVVYYVRRDNGNLRSRWGGLLNWWCCPLRHCPLVSWWGESSHNVWSDGEPADAMPPLRPYVQNIWQVITCGWTAGCCNGMAQTTRLPERLWLFETSNQLGLAAGTPGKSQVWCQRSTRLNLPLTARDIWITLKQNSFEWSYTLYFSPLFFSNNFSPRQT